MRRTLSDIAEFHLVYEDKSPFGQMVSGDLEKKLKYMARPIANAVARDATLAIRLAPTLLEAHGFGEGDGLFDDHGDVIDAIARPDPRDAFPAALSIRDREGTMRHVALPAAIRADISRWMSAWQDDARRPSDGAASDLWDRLDGWGCFDLARESAVIPGIACFVGHATVLFQLDGKRVLVDPFLLPRGSEFPASYQPLTPVDLQADLILITHSHRDHFHIDTLMRMNRNTPIVLPRICRDSALTIDMAYRLEELGFAEVRELAWHEDIRIDGLRIVALPWHGEQPTTDLVRNPDLRNEGNTYLIEGDGRRFALVADAGQDGRGDVRQVASEALAKYGPVDVLFGGYRCFSLYPLQYLDTSVPQYLLFTPTSRLGVHQRIMNDAHALLDTAERWQARYVVPYADGGAPWHWQLGLGPRQDRDEAEGSVHFDPRPQAVSEAASGRSESGNASIASPCRVLLMRPGESLDFDAGGEARIVAYDKGHWPFAAATGRATLTGFSDEPVGLSRKRVLLRMLAADEMARRGLQVTEDQIFNMDHDLRSAHGLTEKSDLAAWLDQVGLQPHDYAQILTEWQCVIRLEDLLGDEVERRLAGQRAFASMPRAVRDR